MRILSRSLRRKILVTIVASVGFVLLYETTIRDSRYAARLARVVDTSAPAGAGSQMRFSATAYCKGTTTASGVNVRTGIAAADPTLLPVGSVVSVTAPDPKYNGIYTVMDTGPKVQGRTLDLYMWSCHEALAFGRKGVQVTVLRHGWNPKASSPGFLDRLFRRASTGTRSAAPDAPPAVPAPASQPADTPAAAPSAPVESAASAEPGATSPASPVTEVTPAPDAAAPAVVPTARPIPPQPPAPGAAVKPSPPPPTGR